MASFSFFRNWCLPIYENIKAYWRIKAIRKISDLNILISIYNKENEEVCKSEIIKRCKYLIRQLNINELINIYIDNRNSKLLNKEACKFEIITWFKYLLNQLKLNELKRLYKEFENSVFGTDIKQKIIDLMANMPVNDYNEYRELKIKEISKIDDLSVLINECNNEFDFSCRKEIIIKINTLINQIKDVDELITLSKMNNFSLTGAVQRLSEIILTLNNTTETKTRIKNLPCDTALLRLIFEHQDEELRAFAKSVFIEQLKKQTEIEQKTIHLLLKLKIQNHTRFQNRRGKKIEPITLREAVSFLKDYNWNQKNPNDNFIQYRYDCMDKFVSSSRIFRAKNWQFMTLKEGSFG